MDTFTPIQRSNCMSRIKSKNTEPELSVRKAVSQLGLRYRLHKSNLPAKPDIVISKKQSIILINGCFWHQHKGCRRKSVPKSNLAYWVNKLKKNVIKQKKDIKALKRLGWRVLVVWECETKNVQRLEKRLENYLI